MNNAQLPLNLKLQDEATFDHFLIGQNELLINTLKNAILNHTEPFIYCYGESGSGRTHLLQACCHLATHHQSIFYFSLSLHAELSTSVFDGLEQYDCVCIDDIDLVMKNNKWEEALFHFYNRARENHITFIVSATTPPQQLNTQLKDLQSRLQSGLTLSIIPLSDDEKIVALQQRANHRGLTLSHEVAQYLIHHYSRNMRDLTRLLDQLDHASLIAKKRLTVPFVKSVLDKSS